MKLSDVVKLLSQELSPSAFSASIASELAIHLQRLKTKGASAPVIVIEDADVLLSHAGLALLCGMFANGQLSAQELAYTADALQLAERVQFSAPWISEALAECTDPDINGPLTAARARELAGNANAA